VLLSLCWPTPQYPPTPSPHQHPPPQAPISTPSPQHCSSTHLDLAGVGLLLAKPVLKGGFVVFLKEALKGGGPPELQGPHVVFAGEESDAQVTGLKTEVVIHQGVNWVLLSKERVIVGQAGKGREEGQCECGD
jgi:hypothetical protein